MGRAGRAPALLALVGGAGRRQPPPLPLAAAAAAALMAPPLSPLRLAHPPLPSLLQPQRALQSPRRAPLPMTRRPALVEAAGVIVMLPMPPSQSGGAQWQALRPVMTPPPPTLRSWTLQYPASLRTLFSRSQAQAFLPPRDITIIIPVACSLYSPAVFPRVFLLALPEIFLLFFLLASFCFFERYLIICCSTNAPSHPLLLTAVVIERAPPSKAQGGGGSAGFSTPTSDH
jgi:hypothetical protein